MFNIGELVVYSDHGVCKIDDICDKTYGGKTRKYYVLHPIEDTKLNINAPVDNPKVLILKMLDSKEAEEIMQSFSGPGIEWIEDVKLRNKEYNRLIQTGNRKDISDVLNALMRKKQETALDKKQLAEQDRKLLNKTKQILFEELAIALNTKSEDIETRVEDLLGFPVAN
ncbi:CarD family transcriptional regulator [Ornithinibacillus scapharcae]|uniref:CarD family transcriptional regulator n=1 Tax=Ornithinibacillus scapharcae TaxID=1147159 RepID=UPI000225AFF0|nr:CarD family transcriptional regulator [Ornithinibacillus scapharcae]